MAILKNFFKSLSRLFKIRKRLKPPTKRKIKRSSASLKKKSLVLKKSPSKIKKRIEKSVKTKIKFKEKNLSSNVKRDDKSVLVGVITHYFAKIQVVVVQVTAKELNVGDMIQIKGSKTDFKQKILSMQKESVDVKRAKKGELIGLKVVSEANVGDKVFRLN